MAWGSAFLDSLEAGGQVYGWFIKREGIGTAPGTDFTAGSHPSLNCEYCGVLEPTFQGATLSLSSSSLGAWSVEVVGDAAFALVAKHITRGTIIGLYMGFVGMNRHNFERVGLGQIQNIFILPGRNGIRIDLIDILSALRGRFTTSASVQKIFGVGYNTTTTVAHLIGAASYQVNSVSNFEKGSDINGCIQVQGASGTFYRLYSGTSGSAFTISDPSTASVGGTTDTGAVVGDGVYSVAYIKDHPLRIAQRMLVSSGTAGTNGTYDTLPTTWGWGIQREYVDSEDFTRFINASGGTSSTYHWQVFQNEAVDDGYGFLEDMLGRGGFFLTMRQGAITGRCWQLPSTLTGAISGIGITEADIMSSAGTFPEFEHELFCSDWSKESGSARVMSYSGSDVQTLYGLATLPGEYETVFDLSSFVFLNETTIKTEVHNRVSSLVTKVPERLTFDGHIRLAQLAPGDLVTIDTNSLGLTWGRREASLGTLGYNGRRAVVSEVSPQFLQGYCRITLLIFPTSDNIFEV
jgi:hypothetical protein